MTRIVTVTSVVAGVLLAAACGGGEEEITAEDPSANDPVDLGDPPGKTTRRDGGSRRPPAGDAQSSGPTAEGGFATRVVSFKPGKCAGFGQDQMPDIVLGPPQGGGTTKGSVDVVSLGNGGEIVIAFEPHAIVDGPGSDFVVFENAFYASSDTSKPYAEPAEVSVSEDGTNWTAFPCTAKEPPYGACAGWHPVLATADDFDPARAGGDAYDLAAIGVTRARFVKITDRTTQRCNSQGPDTNGFDLDAAYAIHTAPL